MIMNKKPAANYSRSLFMGRLACKAVRSNLVMTRNPVRVIASVTRMLHESCCDNRYGHLSNYRQVNKKYYWHPHIPGYPSAAFDEFVHRWAGRCLYRKDIPHLFAAYIVITNSCPLNCEHCFESDIRNCKEALNDDVLRSIEQVISLGAVRVSLTGGEPMCRLPLIHRVLTHFGTHPVQFWINTSAAGLTRERLKTLKKLGLTGITFSLDHYEKTAHDRFRGQQGCYTNAVSSIQTAVELGFATELALCATNEFISEENLQTYLDLAADLKVAFVQLIEPRSVGKYEGSDVALRPEKRKILESFYLHRITSCDGMKGPLITYPDYHNRCYGCDGGKYHLYVDLYGNASPCPFCKTISAKLAELTPANLGESLFCPGAAFQRV